MFDNLNKQINSLNSKAVTAYEKGHYKQGIEFAKQACELGKYAFGENHPDYASILNNLAGLYQAMGWFTDAEPLFLQAMEIIKVQLGKNHPDHARNLNNLALLYQVMGRFTDAEPLFLQAMDIIKVQLGENHTHYATSLHNLALLYKVMGRFTDAEPLSLQGMDIDKVQLGENHPHYATSLHNLAELYREMGRFTDAKPLSLQAMEIIKVQLGENHPHYATSLHNLALLYEAMGRFTDAKPLSLQAMEIIKEQLGENHPSYATSLNGLALLYQGMGRFMDAKPLFRQAMEIIKVQLGENHPQYATSLNNLAGLYRAMGRLTKAEPLYRQAIEIIKVQLGENHPDYASSLNNLAGLYKAMGRLTDAETFSLQALKIRKLQLGENHPHYATSLNGLALLYQVMERFTDAEHLFRQAMEIMKVQLGENHPSYATSLNGLALLYQVMGRFTDAEPLFLQAMEIIKMQLGENHPDYASSLNNLAGLYRARGRFTDAEPLSLQAMAIIKEQLGENHPSYASSLNNLAILMAARGRFTDAEPLSLQAMAIYQVQLGENHPDYATSLNNLATLMAATDRPDTAFQLMQQANQIQNRTIGEILSISSDRQRLEYMQQNYWQLEVFLSLITQYLPENAAAKQAALDLVLRRKGLATEAGLLLRSLIFSGRYPHLMPEFEKLRQLIQQVSFLTTQMQNQSGERLSGYRAELARVTLEREEVERSLSRQMPEMNLQMHLNHASREAIAQALPKGSTLVEFVRFNVFNFKAVKAHGDKQRFPARYLAFVLPAGEAAGVEMIDLGEAEEIDRLCQTFRLWVSSKEESHSDRDLMRYSRKDKTPVKKASESVSPRIYTSSEGQEVYQKLIAPLKPYLQPQQTVYIAPDGELTTLPFGILSQEGTAYLMDEYGLRYLSVGRDLLRFQFPIPVDYTDSLVIANPDYNLRVEGSFLPQMTPQPHQEEVFTKLPGTQIEGELIAELLGVPLYTEAQAVKSLLSRCRSPKIVHIATHGYFLPIHQTPPDWGMFPQILGSETNPGMPLSVRSRYRAEFQDPMTRAGLALAGANTARQGGILPEPAEEGVLTAQGAFQVDLTGTRLVVLSACNTALGDQTIGEGVLGLRRSFIVAGAETVVMSLWSVPDVPTAILMERFYHNLFQTDWGRTEALEEAQRYLQQITIAKIRAEWLTEEAINEVAQHSEESAIWLKILSTKPDDFRPFAGVKYWAAFVCIGNPSLFPK
ncbi:CHAT domain-containing protein [Laspinema olomoucense]|uniref:CHAT domain-containing protein n=1 Tax=Laspinema olomoucense TaxID=3231600 RepID=UPI0021BB9FCB|nr:CHAT domain-containing tetratricopeptide repeat protein [Laspinema sp. D3d]MCT7970674.1 CHAT domain-containing protein [Laspinema sp. D3d]